MVLEENRKATTKMRDVCLPEHRINHHQQHAYRVCGNVEVCFRLEHTGSQWNTLHIIFILTGAEAYHYDDGHGQQTGVEHLVDEWHIDG